MTKKHFLLTRAETVELINSTLDNLSTDYLEDLLERVYDENCFYTVVENLTERNNMLLHGKYDLL